MIATAARRLPALAEPVPAPSLRIPDEAPPSLGELLSDREEEIARLAARGLSNKQIGQRLSISPWTVATHLRRTFLKLEITRRIELCAFVSALGGTVRQIGSLGTQGAAACRQSSRIDDKSA